MQDTTHTEVNGITDVEQDDYIKTPSETFENEVEELIKLNNL
jgi:hypothetical protein